MDTANIAVTAVDASSDTITVKPSAWGPLQASTPILFGSTAARYGLKPGVPYYIASIPQRKLDPQSKSTTYSFKVSAPGSSSSQRTTCRSRATPARPVRSST